MASFNDRQTGRDFENFDNDRKEGRYAPGGDRASWRDEPPAPLDPAKQAAIDVALAQIERAFGRRVPAPVKGRAA